jgi:nucleotide-binding universal stress UspA family protein
MRILLYAGPAPSRESVLEYSTQIVERCATALTLVTGGGEARRALLDDAVKRLRPPAQLPITQRVLAGNAQTAILTAAREQQHDLVILGRLNQALGRLLPGVRSKAIAQRLEPSVLRVQGSARPIRRILLSSGGDHHTFADVRNAAQIARPLGAAVTVLHVLSQQSVLFEGLPNAAGRMESFLLGESNEAAILREAVALLKQHSITAEVRGRVGPVLDEILAELRHGGYDLLIIGAHRVASALDRILLEDITDDLLDVSPLPVLVVKHEA